MLGGLNRTVRSWIGRYGSEAAFVGRVALAALLPPGCSHLLSQGLEATCEYLQGKADVVGDHELGERLDQLGVPREQLSRAVEQIEGQGQSALERVHLAHQQGIPETTLTEQLRTLIASDPGLSALQTSMREIADQLRRLEAQGETLIAGQQYQTAAIEEMMAMMREIATQVGIPVAQTRELTAQAALPPPRSLQSPRSSPQSLIELTPAQSSSRSDALSSLSSNSSLSGSSSVSSGLSNAPISVSDLLPLSSSPSADVDALALLGQSGNGQQTREKISSLDTLSGGSSSASAGPRLTHQLDGRARREAESLVERFFAQRRARGDAAHVQESEAVKLVERFKSQLESRRARAQAGEAPQQCVSSAAGEGRVAIQLLDAGETPVLVIKWLCETWGYSLQDAIIATQSAPCVVRRDHQFVNLERERQALEKLGARVKLKV